MFKEPASYSMTSLVVGYRLLFVRLQYLEVSPA